MRAIVEAGEQGTLARHTNTHARAHTHIERERAVLRPIRRHANGFDKRSCDLHIDFLLTAVPTAYCTASIDSFHLNLSFETTPTDSMQVFS